MIVKDYIQQRFQSFGISLSEADLYDMCVKANIGMDDVIDPDSHPRINVAVARFIPSLLLRPTSVNESGFSLSWDTEGIKNYYSHLCREYGLKDELNQNPKVTFL